MSPGYKEALQNHDPDFLKLFEPLMAIAMEPDGLDLKIKTLMILFLDATRGEKDAVKALAARARSLGAKDSEIRDAVRLAFLTSGYSALVAGAAAFE